MDEHVRRGRLAAAILAAMGVLSALWVVFHLNDLTFPPWTDRVGFNAPFSTAVDQTGRAYTADSATSRLVALNRDGTLRWILEGRKRAQGFYNAVGLATDSRDDLYVTNWLPFPNQDAIAQEIQIQHYSPDGKLLGTPFRLENPSRREDFPGYFSFSVQSDHLSVVHGTAVGYELLTAPLTGGDPTLIRTLGSPTDFVSIASSPSGFVAGAARNGTLWTAEPSGDWVPNPVAGIDKPWDLKFDLDGDLLILDLLQGKIFKKGANALQVVLDSDVTGGTFSDTFTVGPNGTVVVADKELQRLLISPIPGDFRVFAGAMFDGITVVGHWLSWLAICLALLAGGSAALLGWLYVVRRRVPLVVIQVALMLPVLIGAQALMFDRVYTALFSRYKEGVRSTLSNAANISAKTLSGKDLLLLSSPADLDSEAYARLKKQALEIRAVGRSTEAFSYIALYRNVDGQARIVLTGSGIFGVLYPYPIFPSAASSLFTTPGVKVADYADDYGEYSGGFASVLAPDGTPAGVVEVGLYADLVKDVENTAFSDARNLSILACTFFSGLLLILTIFLVRSLNTLRKIARAVARGTWSPPAELESLDPHVGLPRKLIQLDTVMTAQLAANERFVPRQILNLFDEQDLTKLKKGDLIDREMTILHVELSDSRFRDAVVSSIRAHRGVVLDGLAGDCLGLFDRGPRDAWEAFKLASRRSTPQTGGKDLHFGLHRGTVGLGLVGSADRLWPAVLSPDTGKAKELQELSRAYQVPVVATASTLALLPGVVSRKLDHIRFPGAADPLLVCEPIDDLDPRQAIVLDYLAGYQAAFLAWEQGDHVRALRGFEVIAARNPEDAVVRRLVNRCRRIGKTAPTGEWNPAVDLGTALEKVPNDE